jgi:hypothetical protein
MDKLAMREATEQNRKDEEQAAAAAMAVAAAKASLNTKAKAKAKSKAKPKVKDPVTTKTPKLTPSVAHTKKAFEDRGGQERTSTKWHYNARNTDDTSKLPALIYESLHRASLYDIAFTAYSVDGNFVDIESLKTMDLTAMSYLFWTDWVPKPTSNKADAYAMILIQCRRQFRDIKQIAFKYAWMKMHNLWIDENDETTIRMERCGWIQMVARGTICPGIYKSTIMTTISSNITDEENETLRTTVEEDGEIEIDEFNDV